MLRTNETAAVESDPPTPDPAVQASDLVEAQRDLIALVFDLLSVMQKQTVRITVMEMRLRHALAQPGGLKR